MSFSFPFATAAIILSSLLASCSILPSMNLAEEPVRAGMTSKEVRAEFGRPLAIKYNEDGSQVWTYRFATTEHWMGPEPGWDEAQYHAGGENGKSISFEKAAIHLSPALKVEGEIPNGQVVRR